MKEYRVYQIDAFTKTLFKGNPAGVVLDADGLSATQMQSIARELNNSETAFVFESKTDEYDIEIRYFTPSIEVPICGHATISAHYIRSKVKNLPTSTLTMKTKAGILPVDILHVNGDYEILMTQGIFDKHDLEENTKKEICQALGLVEDNLNQSCPIQWVSAGHSKIMIGINSETLLNKLTPDNQKLIQISQKIDCTCYFVFVLNENEEYLSNGRMFAPAIGIDEDPVTGNANGPLGGYLVSNQIIKTEPNSTFNFKAKQGVALNRMGSMQVYVSTDNNNQVSKIQIQGQAIKVFETKIQI